MVDDLNGGLRRLGRLVSDVSDHAPNRDVLDAARRRWSARQDRPAPRRLWLALPAAAALVLGLGFAAREAYGRRAISFEVGVRPAHGDVGEWIAADTASLPVRFSEGTTLDLTPGARVRVTETTNRGAGILIERGGLDAAVVHQAGTRWIMHAGPFEVRVTGTRFHAGWDPSTDTFDLDMKEGSVVVSGPLLPTGQGSDPQAGRAGAEDGQLVAVAGDKLRISMRDGHLEFRARSAPPLQAASPAVQGGPLVPDEASPTLPTARERSETVLDAKSTAAAPAGPASVATRALVASPSPSPSTDALIGPRSLDLPAPGFRELAAAGKFKEAMEVVDREGFAQAIERGSMADLLALADLARYASRPAQARDALLAMRRRFGARGRSAFLLGKIEADQLGSSANAVRWLETYLVEEPGGGLAEQALGRLIELHKGNPAAARAAAERYLGRYPGGTYAALARSLLGP